MTQLRALWLAPSAGAAQRLYREVEVGGAALELTFVSSLPDASARLAARAEDVVVLDPSVFDGPLASTVRRVRRLAPRAGLVVLTDTTEADGAAAAIASGAQECVDPERATAADLVRAVRLAVERKRASEEILLAHRLLELATHGRAEDELLDSFVTELWRGCRCESAVVRLRTEDGSAPVARRRGPPHPILDADSPEWLDGGASSAAQSVHLDGAGRIRRSEVPGGDGAGGYGVLVAPVCIGESLVGYLQLGDPDASRFGEQLRLLVADAALQLGAALQRLRAIEALQASERHFRSLVEASPDAILRTTRRGAILSANGRAAELLGANSTAEMLGTNLFDRLVRDDGTRFPPGGPDPVQPSRVELASVVQPGLPRRRIELSVGPSAESEAGVAVQVVVLRDVTALHQAQCQLAQADRMASLGVLAAGVAHEINNPLTYVLYNLDVLREELPALLASAASDGRTPRAADQPEHAPGRPPRSTHVTSDVDGPPSSGAPRSASAALRMLDAAIDGARKVRDISRDLKLFAHVQEDDEELVSPVKAVESALNLTHHELKYRAHVVRDFTKVGAVRIANGRLCQVILNLLINAAHAIDAGKKPRNEVRVTIAEDTSHVVIAVSDTGCGIRPEHVPHLFEPFFTTKPPGVGSGLGLPICRSLIEQAGGELTVVSAPGVGATFTVRLPRAELAAPRSAAGHSPPPPSLAPARILVVDDEPQVLLVLGHLLRGHELLCVSSAREAMGVLSLATERFDMVLTDVMMDELDGVALFQWIQRERPDLSDRVVLMTGGVFLPETSGFIESHRLAVLEKPFDAARVRAAVDRVLSEVGRAPPPSPSIRPPSTLPCLP